MIFVLTGESFARGGFSSTRAGGDLRARRSARTEQGRLCESIRRIELFAKSCSVCGRDSRSWPCDCDRTPKFRCPLRRRRCVHVGKPPDPRWAFAEAPFALGGSEDATRSSGLAGTQRRRRIDTSSRSGTESYEIPIPATAGQTLSILTSGRDVHDTILCCSRPTVHRCWGAMSTDGSLPDFNAWPRRAAFSESGFTSFESVDILDLVVRR
jgi:hypothetical protein